MSATAVWRYLKRKIGLDNRFCKMYDKTKGSWQLSADGIPSQAVEPEKSAGSNITGPWVTSINCTQSLLKLLRGAERNQP